MIQVKRGHRGRVIPRVGAVSGEDGPVEGWARPPWVPRGKELGGKGRLALCPVSAQLMVSCLRAWTETYSVGPPSAQAFRSPTLGPGSLHDHRRQFPLIHRSLCVFILLVLILCRTLKTHLSCTQLAAAGAALGLCPSRWHGLGTWFGARHLPNGFCSSPTKKASWTFPPALGRRHTGGPMGAAVTGRGLRSTSPCPASEAWATNTQNGL